MTTPDYQAIRTYIFLLFKLYGQNLQVGLKISFALIGVYEMNEILLCLNIVSSNH